MNPRLLTILGASALVAGVFPHAALAGPAFRLACHRVELKGSKPQHIASSAWLEIQGQQRLAVVDSAMNRTLFYDLNGIPDRKAETDFSRLVDLPAALKGSGANLIAADARNSFLSVDKNLTSVSPKLPLPGGSGTGQVEKAQAKALLDARYRLGGLKEWSVIDNQVVGFGPLRRPAHPENDSDYGFFAAPAADLADITDLPGPHALNKAERDYFRIGTEFVASSGSNSFVLVPRTQEHGEPSMIWKVKSGENGTPSRLVPFAELPEGYEHVPQITSRMGGPQGVEVLFAELETLKMPVALLGQGESLSLIVREPGPDGQTSWRLYRMSRVNTTGGEWQGPYDLPTAARHLHPLSNGSTLFFLEGGRVSYPGVEDVNSVLVCNTPS